jgi:uncharacterized glyoxalase superfamily protein PhnB
MSTDSTTDNGGSLEAVSFSASMTVKDLEKSIAWYRDSLGFRVERRNERDGKLVSVALSAGSASVLLNQDNGAKGFDRIKGQGISLYFVTQQSVDDLATKAKANGASLLAEPADMPWGVRMIALNDLDGFKLVFAKPLA